MRQRLCDVGMRSVSAALLLGLTGCYCMPDKGDSPIGGKGYFSGCWAEASKDKGKAN